MSRLIGVLKNIADLEYDFICEDGSIYHLTPSIARGVQFNYRIWLDIDTGEWGRLEEVAGSPVIERKRVLLLRTCDDDTSDTELEALLDGTERIALEVERFYRHYCGDIWDVLVYSDVVRYEQAPWDNNWNAKLFNDYVNERGYPYGFFNYNHCWSHFGHASYCGLGQLYGKYSWTQVSCGLHTIIHELGHNFGLHHATKDGKEYGDKTCVMGAGGSNIPGLNAPHLAKLRAKARRPFASVSEDSFVALVPMQTPDHFLFPDESVLAEVNGSSRVWLSLRRHRGAQYDFTVPSENKVHIHTKSSDGKTDFVGYLAPGDTERLPNGAKCSYLEHDGERAILWITYSGAPVPQSGKPSFSGLFPWQGDPYKDWWDGQWYSPKMDGSGLSILGGQMHWFGFEPSEVSFTRYIQMNEHLTYGTSRIKMLDRNNALMLINRPQTGRDAVELKRLSTPPTGADSGVYVSGDKNWTMHLHRGVVIEGGVVVEIALIGSSTGTWYYAQNGAVYTSKSGRWMQENFRTMEEVGIFSFSTVDGVATLALKNITHTIDFYGV